MTRRRRGQVARVVFVPCACAGINFNSAHFRFSMTSTCLLHYMILVLDQIGRSNRHEKPANFINLDFSTRFIRYYLLFYSDWQVYNVLPFCTGCCLVENVSPPSGSIIADFGGLLNNTIFMCDVIVNNGSQQITTQWFIENLGGNTGLRALPQDANLFLLTGDQRPSDPSLTFNNHLVLLNLTSNLDDATIYCGTGQNPRQANFSLRIYRKLQTIQFRVM